MMKPSRTTRLLRKNEELAKKTEQAFDIRRGGNQPK
jgi:hypothetical protein